MPQFTVINGGNDGFAAARRSAREFAEWIFRDFARDDETFDRSSVNFEVFLNEIDSAGGTIVQAVHILKDTLVELSALSRERRTRSGNDELYDALEHTAFAGFQMCVEQLTNDRFTPSCIQKRRRQMIEAFRPAELIRRRNWVEREKIKLPKGCSID